MKNSQKLNALAERTAEKARKQLADFNLSEEVINKIWVAIEALSISILATSMTDELEGYEDHMSSYIDTEV